MGIFNNIQRHFTSDVIQSDYLKAIKILQELKNEIKNEIGNLQKNIFSSLLECYYGRQGIDEYFYLDKTNNPTLVTFQKNTFISQIEYYYKIREDKGVDIVQQGKINIYHGESIYSLDIRVT